MGFSRMGLTAQRSGVWDAPRRYYNKDLVIWQPLHFTWATEYDSSAFYDIAYSFSTVAKDGGEVQTWSPWSDQKSMRKAKDDPWFMMTREGGAYVRRANLVNLIPELFPTGRSHIWEERRFDAIRIRFGIKAVDSNGKDITSREWVTTAVYYMPRVSVGDTTLTRHGLQVGVSPADGWGRKDDLFLFGYLRPSASQNVDVSMADVADGWQPENDGSVLFPWIGSIIRPADGAKVLSMAVRPWYFDEPDGYEFAEHDTTLVDASEAGTPTMEVTVAYNGDIYVQVSNDSALPIETVLVEILGSEFAEDMVEVQCPGTAILRYAPYSEFTVQATGLTATGIGEPEKQWVTNKGEYVDLIPTADASKRVSIKTGFDYPWSIDPMVDEVLLLGRKYPTAGYGDGVISSGKLAGTYLEDDQPTRTVEGIASAGPVIVRFPNGERRRCAVKGVETNNEMSPGAGLRSVSVSLLEVG